MSDEMNAPAVRGTIPVPRRRGSPGEVVEDQPDEAGVQRVDRFIWKNRNVLAGLPLAFALISTQWQFENGAVVWSFAVTLCLVGVALRAWSNCHCWYGLRKPMFLATSGPYACVRNPLYIGNMLIIASAAVASELIWFVPVILVWEFVVFTRVVRYEEDQLLLKFGDDWLGYREQLPRWLPRWGRLAIGRGYARFFVAALRESPNLLILLPFLLKELNPAGLWPHP